MNLAMRRFHQADPAFEAGLSDLLALYGDTLMSDADRHRPACLLENTLSCVPYLWMATDPLSPGSVWAVAALSDIQPGRHAFLHGVRHPAVRRHAIVSAMAETAIRCAFTECQALKVKIEFDAHNRGARGFARRLGFRREGYFHHDVMVGGVSRDVVIASLPRERFREGLA